jgi:hypothetical protein
MPNKVLIVTGQAGDSPFRYVCQDAGHLADFVRGVVDLRYLTVESTEVDPGHEAKPA